MLCSMRAALVATFGIRPKETSPPPIRVYSRHETSSQALVWLWRPPPAHSKENPWVLLNVRQDEISQHRCGLRMQGKLACMEFADHSVSHSVFWNAAVGEDVLRFTIKVRLQGLPTKYNQSTWYPQTHDPFCLNHQDSQYQLE